MAARSHRPTVLAAGLLALEMLVATVFTLVMVIWPEDSAAVAQPASYA